MNKEVLNYFYENGYQVDGNACYGIFDGYEVNILLNNSSQLPPIIVHISSFLTYEQKENIKSELEKIKISKFKLDSCGLVFGLKDITHENTDRLNEIISEAISILKKANALGYENCPICATKLDDTNKKQVKIANFKITLDNNCIDKFNEEIENSNKVFLGQPNNILKGLLGAVIGATVGAIIAYVLFLIGYIASISAIVAAFLGCYLYKKFGGKPNVYMYLIVSVTSLVFLLGVYFLVYVQAAGVLVEGKSGIEAFNAAMEVTEFKAEFTSNMLMTFCFTAIGIVCAIIDETKRNKRSTSI